MARYSIDTPYGTLDIDHEGDAAALQPAVEQWVRSQSPSQHAEADMAQESPAVISHDLIDAARGANGLDVHKLAQSLSPEQRRAAMASFIQAEGLQDVAAATSPTALSKLNPNYTEGGGPLQRMTDTEVMTPNEAASAIFLESPKGLIPRVEGGLAGPLAMGGTDTEKAVIGGVNKAIDTVEGLATGSNLMMAAALPGAPSIVQKGVAAVFAAQFAKAMPEKITAFQEATTPEEKGAAATDLGLNTLMLLGSFGHMAGRSNGVPLLREGKGATQAQIDNAIRLAPEPPKNAEIPDEMLDGIVASKDAAAKAVEANPQNETLRRLNTAVARQLSDVPEERLNAARERLQQQRQSTPPAEPAAGGETAVPSEIPRNESPTETTPTQGDIGTGTSALFQKLKQEAQITGEIAPETASAVPAEATPVATEPPPAGETTPASTQEQPPTAGRAQQIVNAEIEGLKQARDPSEALDHMEGIEDDSVRQAIAKQYGIDTEGKSANDLNLEIADKAAEVNDAIQKTETNEPQPSEMLPDPADYGLPKTSLGASGGTMTRRVVPLGITPKMPMLLEHMTDVLAGIAEMPQVKDLTQSLKGTLGQIGGRTFPKLSVLDKGLGELGARWISSKIAARPSGMMFATQVLEGLGVDPLKLGTALHEDNLRSIRAGFEKAGDAEKAAEVKTTIGGKGSPFKTEGEYQSFLADPATKAAIEKHKAMWESTVEPQYRKAMSLDPSIELPTRGLQTGARINLNPIIEGEKAGQKVVTVGQGNLLGTMRKKSVFGREAKGTAGAYSMNYFDTMVNTFARQLETANKNAFEDALVEKGFAKIDKPGQQIEINGREAKAYPYKRQTLILPGEGGAKAVPQSRNLYIDPRLQGEYESAANILRHGVGASKILGPVNKILNNAALTGLTDATVHMSNLATALLTRPASSGGLLLDTLLSLTGRADAPVTIVRALIKGFRNNEAQIKELAEIGALREEHPAGGSPFNPATWTSKAIQWADKTARLSLDDAYKRMADAGLVDKSETNRREFVNQVGQYNKRAQGAYVRFLRDSGISPFITAGKTFNAMAVRTATLDPGLEAASLPAATALRVNQLSKWVGAIGMITAANYLVTGKAAGRPGVPLGAIDTGKDDANGKPLYYKVFDMLGLMRAARVTGVRGFVEAKRSGLTNADAVDSATRDVVNTVTGPLMGPPIRFLSTVMNTPVAMGIGKPVASVARGESQTLANVTQAVIHASPLLASIVDRFKTGGSFMESMQRQFPRYLPQSGKSPDMMANYAEYVGRAQTRSFTNDVIGQARKLEPKARKEFLDNAFSRLPNKDDQDYFLRTLKYSRIKYP